MVLAEPPEQAEAAEYSAFAAGEVAALVVTQREVRLLELRRSAGKQPSWTVAGGARFTDQVLLCAFPETTREDAAARRAAGMAFLTTVLSDDMQTKISVSRAFPVVDIENVYEARSPYQPIEEALSDPLLQVAPAFGDGWRDLTLPGLNNFLSTD